MRRSEITRMLSAFLAMCLLCMCAACSHDNADGMDDKPSLTVWVYSQDYKDTIEHCFYSDMVSLSWKLNVECVGAAELDERFEQAEESGSLPDIIMLTPANLQEYVQSDVLLSIDEVGLDINPDDYYKYTLDAGKDSEGVLRAVCWQPDPGLFFYRRSMAKVYLGTDDPDELQGMIGTWDDFYNTAKTVREKSGGSTYMIAGLGDLTMSYMAADTVGWIKDGKFAIPETAEALVDYAVSLVGTRSVYDAEQWSSAWVAGISDSESVFGYFSSGIGMDSILIPACNGQTAGEGSFGDWGCVEGPQAFNWGGCWFAVTSKTDMLTQARTFLEYFITEEEAMRKNCLVNGTFSSKITVVENAKFDAQFSTPFLAGQNYYRILAQSAADCPSRAYSEYDAVINVAFDDYVRDSAFGIKTRAQARGDFVKTVQAAFPELF